MEIYRTSEKCKNCRTVNWLEIEKSVKMKDHCQTNRVLCAYCNCDLFPINTEE